MQSAVSDSSYSWEPVPHTADLAIAVGSDDEAGLFRAAYEGLMGLLEIDTGESNSGEVTEHALNMVFSSLEDGLVDFLNECIYLMDAEDMVPFRIRSLEYQTGQLRAEFDCREVRAEERPRIAHVKAATYSNLKVTRTGGKYSAKVIFDT